MSAFGPEDDESVATSPFEDEEEAAAPVSPAPSVQASGGDAANDYLALPADSLPPEQQGPAVDDWRAGAAGPVEESQPMTGTDSDWMNPVAIPTRRPMVAIPNADRELQALRDRYATESTENTKPSGWRRFAAGLAGGAVTFGSRNPAAGMAVADRINNAPLANAQERNARAEKPLVQDYRNAQQRIADAERQNQQINQENAGDATDYRNEVTQQYDRGRVANARQTAEAKLNAPVSFTPNDPDNPYAGGTVRTARGETIKDQPPPSAWLTNWEKNPENKAKAQSKAGVMTLKALEEAGVKLTPEQRAIVASGGKITPSVRTSINIAENPDGSARTPGAGSKLPQGIDKIIADGVQQKEAYAQQFRQRPDGRYRNIQTGSIISAPEFESKIEAFRTKLNANANMRKAGVYIDEQGQTRTGQSQPQQAPTQARFNVAKWKAANPQGDVNAAIAAARAKNYTIVGP